MIPSLKYQDLQGFRDVKPADIKGVSVQDAIAAAQVPGRMREQMAQSYAESRQQNQARIDTLRGNLKSMALRWTRLWLWIRDRAARSWSTTTRRPSGNPLK